MKRPESPTPALAASAIPEPVLGIVETLGRLGHPSYLVGGCVRSLLRAEATVDYDIATAASPEAVLDAFARAIPTGLRHGTVMIPTDAGPVDVTTFRAGPKLEDDLAHRDFTINAMAYAPGEDALVDPFGGAADLEQRRLRAVGSARDRFAEDPLRALRAARLAATLDLQVDPAVEAAMATARTALPRVARERIRHELRLMMLSRRPGVAIGLLRRTGIEADLFPGAREDAARVVDGLPARLELRLAGWLRGTQAVTSLRRLRFSGRVQERVLRMVRLHPVETGADPARGPEVRRLLKRVGEESFESLVALRDAELAIAPEPDADRQLRALVEAVAAVRRTGALALHRHDLAIAGNEVMRILDCGPGRAVGEALEYLTERVIEDPACNTPEALRALLEARGGRGVG